MQKITVLVGGTGGARFSQALVQALGSGAPAAADSVTIIAATAADAWLHGLKVSPDLDAVLRALGGSADAGTSTVVTELAAYGVEPTWFAATDRDVATHLVRTQMLEAGYPLSAVTEALSRRWLTAYDGRVRLLPVTDDRVETHVAVLDADAPSGRRTMHLQELWSRGPATQIEAAVTVGLEQATPAPGVLEAIAEADRVVVVPGDALLVPGLLGVPGVAAALEAREATTVTAVGDAGVLAAVAAQGLVGTPLEVALSDDQQALDAAYTAIGLPRHR